MNPIRIVVVDQNTIAREGIIGLLSKEEDLLLVGSSNGRDRPLQKIHRKRPQVILVDPGLNLIGVFRKQFPLLKIIAVGHNSGHSDILNCFREGASGFVLKTATRRRFLSAVRAVNEGNFVFPNTVAKKLFPDWKAIPPAAGKMKRDHRVTPRQEEIVRLIVKGLTNKEIALQLNISPETVKSHVRNILQRLRLRSRMDLARYEYQRISKQSSVLPPL